MNAVTTSVMAKMLVPPMNPPSAVTGGRSSLLFIFSLPLAVPCPHYLGLRWGGCGEDNEVVAADFLVLRLGELDLCTINLTQEKESFLEMILLMK